MNALSFPNQVTRLVFAAGQPYEKFCGRYQAAVLAGWLRAMIGPWGLPRDRVSASAALPALGREELFPVPGCSSSSGPRPG